MPSKATIINLNVTNFLVAKKYKLIHGGLFYEQKSQYSRCFS